MKRYLQFAMTATVLSFGLIAVASAEITQGPTDRMQGMNGGTGMGMQQMQGGAMMSMMMGKDPVAGCTSMMKSVAADPAMHKKMNAMMRSQMGADRGASEPSTQKP